MTGKERLVDALRFGPMAMMMRGWPEESMRIRLCEQIADDLLSQGYRWVEPAERESPHVSERGWEAW